MGSDTQQHLPTRNPVRENASSGEHYVTMLKYLQHLLHRYTLMSTCRCEVHNLHIKRRRHPHARRSFCATKPLQKLGAFTMVICDRCCTKVSSTQRAYLLGGWHVCVGNYGGNINTVSDQPITKRISFPDSRPRSHSHNVQLKANVCAPSANGTAQFVFAAEPNGNKARNVSEPGQHIINLFCAKSKIHERFFSRNIKDLLKAQSSFCTKTVGKFRVRTKGGGKKKYNAKVQKHN